MTQPWTPASLADVRCLIAREATRGESVGERLGDITLRAHQRRAADRLIASIARHGGALLAEPVGVGKTYTALAVAAHRGGSIFVVAPASLRDMWRDAAQRSRVAITFASHESFSRGTSPGVVPDLVIIDEAHRLRSPHTHRYALIADLARRAQVLLVTATPVHNRRDDLSAQLALFLGRVAWQLSDEALAEYVVRDSGSSLGARPRLDGPHRVSLDVDDDCLEQLLALPDPVPPRDASVAGALLTYGLLHQWASSRAALVAALRRRRARGVALIAALETGRRPTRAELAAWTQADDIVQLAFPEIVSTAAPADVDTGALLTAVDRHNAAIEALLHTLRTSPTADPDDARASALLRIRAAHPSARIIAFCQYAETVNALRTRLAREPGVAALTASGARVAGGPISREQAIVQFSPHADAARAPRIAERIDLLVTTDLLSEGLNLQEASVIVHLDLPWNPARLEQRVGRALRLGSRHDAVTVYMIAPPAPAERLLRIESRLREKLNVAQRTVGIAGRILPSAAALVPHEPALAERRGAFDAALRGWLCGDRTAPPSAACAVASAATRERGFLAIVRGAHGPLLVADMGDEPSVAAAAVGHAIALCTAACESPIDPGRIDESLRTLGRWLSARRAHETIDLGAVTAARTRRTTLARVAQALARSPRHRRSSLAPLADAARAVAWAPLGEGAERILETLVRAELPDEAWLRSIAAFAELNVRPVAAPDRPAANSEIIAIIVFDDSAAVTK
jgi:Helicase conserved C-terminal domain/ATPase family associated with various cellular activities (AAA)